MASVTLEHITKTYESKRQSVRAVDDVSLSIADREFVVLVGPSGCGKTTTLRLVAGLEEVEAGTIRIGKRVVNDVAPKDRNVAMVFQNYALYPHLTVSKNMGLGLKLRRMPKPEIRKRVVEAAAMLGIESKLDRMPAALSGGERQRVAIGRAIVRRPEVFLFDEPLSNLDAKLRIHMRTELKRLHHKLQTTAIYVTHDQEEAMTLAERLVVMKDGVVQQVGTPLDVYARPSNRFVAGFMGTPSMNFLSGTLARDKESVLFAGSIGRMRLPDAQAASLAPFVGENVTMGIRPEHLDIESCLSKGNLERRRPAAACIRATVAVVEPLGDRIHVHLVAPSNDRLIGRVSPTSEVLPGATVQVQIDVSKVHLFRKSGHEPRI